MTDWRVIEGALDGDYCALCMRPFRAGEQVIFVPAPVKVTCELGACSECAAMPTPEYRLPAQYQGHAAPGQRGLFEGGT